MLLVGDHADTLSVLMKLLHQQGHQVTGVNSIAAAIAVTKRERFDLLLSDLGLPDGSGLELMRQVREQYTGKGIALTGYGMQQDVEGEPARRFTAHLTKPIDCRNLEDAIRKVVGLVHP